MFLAILNIYKVLKILSNVNRIKIDLQSKKKEKFSFCL